MISNDNCVETTHTQHTHTHSAHTRNHHRWTECGYLNARRNSSRTHTHLYYDLTYNPCARARGFKVHFNLLHTIPYVHIIEMIFSKLHLHTGLFVAVARSRSRACSQNQHRHTHRYGRRRKRTASRRVGLGQVKGCLFMRPAAMADETGPERERPPPPDIDCRQQTPIKIRLICVQNLFLDWPPVA